MENLPPSLSSANTNTSGMTVAEFLTPPFQQVSILRKLGPYGRMLRLEPATPKAPDPEFLVRLLTDHAGHQAHIRHGAGSHYKNLENLLRGTHKASSTTIDILTKHLSLPQGYLEEKAGSAADGPLMPDILALFKVIEGLPMRVTSITLSSVVPCPCCGENLLADVDAWWSNHAPGIGRAEYNFVERLLNALVGVGLVESIIATYSEPAPLAFENLDRLANPLHYSIGNWIREAQAALSCKTLSALVTVMQLRGGIGATFSYGRLKKWSAGQDVMPLVAGEAIAEASGQAKSGIKRLMAARTIALATDFVAASWPTTVHAVSREEAQKVVHARLVQLGTNLRIAIAAMAGQTPPLSRLSANTASS